LTRTLQAQFAQSNTDGVNRIGGHRAGGKQRHLPAPAFVLHLDRLAPCLPLIRVDLTEVEHLTLYNTTVGQPPVLHHAPVVVPLAVFQSSVAAQEHRPSVETPFASAKDQGLHHTRFASAQPYEINDLYSPTYSN